VSSDSRFCGLSKSLRQSQKNSGVACNVNRWFTPDTGSGANRMPGPKQVDQAALLYEVSLERHVTARPALQKHALRALYRACSAEGESARNGRKCR
jgi:hypothetical protein